MIGAVPSVNFGSAGEAAIVALAMTGDDEDYGELVRRKQQPIRILLRRLTRDTSLADDLAQQAFIQAWKAIGTLKSPMAFGAWLRKLAVNCWLAHARARQHRVAWGEAPLPEAAAPPSIGAQLDLDAALSRLPPDVRLCIVLAYSEGMSHSQIVESTAIPLGTVKSHIVRGSARLRQLLQDYGDQNVRLA